MLIGKESINLKGKLTSTNRGIRRSLGGHVILSIGRLGSAVDTDLSANGHLFTKKIEYFWKFQNLKFQTNLVHNFEQN